MTIKASGLFLRNVWTAQILLLNTVHCDVQYHCYSLNSSHVTITVYYKYCVLLLLLNFTRFIIVLWRHISGLTLCWPF